VFERFTERARRVVVLAQEEARMLDHNYIGTEHILLGLIHEGEGVAAKALESLGISLEAVRQQVEDIIGQGQSASTGHIPFTPRAKKVLELSLREALELGHNYIGTEHLLLGLAREGEGVAAQVLMKQGADMNRIREKVVQFLGSRVRREERPSRSEPSLPGQEAFLGEVRMVVREELAAARRQPDPEGGPYCPGCRARLAETGRYRTIDVPAHEGGGATRPVAFAFCGRCGTWLGTLP
jgi:ATP-dependent Clp protease ATP-binding subunit ClpA